MAIKPDLVVEYARNFQKFEIAADRAAQIAGEFDRLVAGVFAAAARLRFQISYAQGPRDLDDALRIITAEETVA